MQLRDILIDFAIPVIIIGAATFLLISGIDGEVKSILTMAAGWAFHGAIRAKR
ncbi:hypothetical protein ES703_53679 [subsurface metagenome]